ncbi:sensor domain-containing diguanylate cyclase [Paenibacillus nanensis]|uniref:Sensor domain-containing diguanylate cyclase n=1 Tax=Paenibacillus nanensis TaxID=393251 RepID=A0A3A1VKM3_9BACL|nr:sensor domain-containing diguanylate cyclase [Paenibacillus nanensis]RIX60186.1 sensor domain-containing diguanylate cyclase [Paenibacillus nanensis]
MLIVIVVISMSVTVSGRTSAALKNEIGGSLSALASQMSDKLEHYMWSRYNEVLLLSKLDAVKEPEQQEKGHELLQELNRNIPSFSWVGIADTEGKVVASTGNILLGESIAERPVFKEALKEPFIGDVHDAVLLAKLLPNPSGEPLKLVDISTPLYDGQGKFSGVLAAHLSWKWSEEIRAAVFDSLQEEKTSQIEAFVISGRDHAVLLGPNEWVGQSLTLEGAEENSEDRAWEVQTWPDGKRYLTGFASGAGYQNYPGLDWRIIIRQPVDVAFSPVKQLVFDIAVLGIILMPVFAWIGWMLAGRVSKPLSRIAAAADRLRFGEKAEIPLTKGIKDIEMLSSSLRGLIRELSETESELVQMEDRAHHDRLTGLLNRASLETRGKKAREQAVQREGGLAFFYLDLDGFKGVNDTYGHAAGDEVLRETARRLTNCVREQGDVFRMGGDEFVIILSLSSSGARQEAQEAASRLLESLRQPYVLGAEKVDISCSIGGAMWPRDGEDTELLLKRADEALYLSKSKGKNQFAFFVAGNE